MMSHSGSLINKDTRAHTHTLDSTQLPDGLLADVALFLSKPSRALFAVAMTSPHEQSPTNQAILSSSQQWDTLDFGDIERALAAKLSDEDIAAVLLCIDAANFLKILKLTGCVNIVGHGLEPLRGSTVLEQIDLSLVGQHEPPNSVREMKLSESAVVPILQSINDSKDTGLARQSAQLALLPEEVDPCDAESGLFHNIGKRRRIWDDWRSAQIGAALKYIQLPQKWCEDRSPLLREFLQKRVQFLEDHGASCSRCTVLLNQPIRAGDEFSQRFTMHEEGNYRRRPFGKQEFTCYNCLKHFCKINCGEKLGKCDRCEKSYCKDCVEIQYCDICPESKSAVCIGCGSVSECDDCGDITCEDCGYKFSCCNRTQCKDCLHHSKCAGCKRVVCNYCEGEDVRCCDDCQTFMCHPCRAECSIGEDACQGCKVMVHNDAVVKEWTIDITSYHKITDFFPVAPQEGSD